MAKLKHDAAVGRLLLIDAINLPDLTAEEFISYVKEGFIPTLLTPASGVDGASYEFLKWTVADEEASTPGAVLLKQNNTTIATFPPADDNPQLPSNFD